MNAASPMVSARTVEHDYGHNGVHEQVLHGVDLTLTAGEFVVVMGPSGCGKSTLLNILGLMLTPTRAAALEIAGTDTRSLSETERARLRRQALGFVFQRFNLLPTISVRENVALPLRIRGEDVGRRPDELLERVGLTAMAHKKPGRLSIGQQQRVAIARALVGRPALLLADEPTGNLDSGNAAGVLGLIQEFHRDWVQTVLLITHNEHLAVGADRVLHMRDGRFVETT